MKKFFLSLILIGSLMVIERDGVYDIKGTKNKDSKTFEGQVFQDRDYEINGYVQRDRYSRKIPVKGRWDGKGSMVLRDSLGVKYNMEVEEDEEFDENGEE